MARDFNGTTQNAGITAVPSTPFTMACWALADAIAADMDMMTVCASGNNTHYHRMYVPSASSKVSAATKGGGTEAGALTSTTISTATWFHACAVFNSATDRRAFLNGGGKGTNVTSTTPTSPAKFSIGCFSGSSSIEFWDGAIAEAAVWTVALTDAEIAALATGINPCLVQPTSLWGYWPLWGSDSPEVDLSGNARNLTLTNTPTQRAVSAPVAPFSAIGQSG